MKIISYCTLIMFLMASCSDKQKITQEPNQEKTLCNSPKLKTFKSIHSKSLSDFKTWTKSWKESDHKLEVPVKDELKPLEYFSIPFDDIEELGDLEGVHSVRAYIGKTGNNDNEYHLLFVPVCNPNNETSDSGDEGDANFDVILDYTNTCPTRCD